MHVLNFIAPSIPIGFIGLTESESEDCVTLPYVVPKRLSFEGNLQLTDKMKTFYPSSPSPHYYQA